AILQISEAIKSYYLIVLGVTFVALGYLYQQRKKQWFRKVSSSLILRIPLIGPIIQKIYLARLCHSLTLLIGSQIPLLRAITMVKQMIGFYPIEVSLSYIEVQIVKGDSLHSTLQHFAIYPKRMVA